MRKKSETQLHFIGIGGIGMSGIAEVFLNQGYRVTGSDAADSDTVRRLQSLGARIRIGHAASSVQGAHVVVISSAIRPENPELLEARRLRIPVIPRAEMLGELMRGKTGIAVAGTHGKTTTTSMLATVLTEAGLDPTLVIGGKVDLLGGNAKLGQGSLVVAEADESDGSFLHLPATYGVVTNVDDDHLDHYGSGAAIEQAFVDFVGKLPFYGMAAICADDPGVQRCLPRFVKPFVTYGFSPDRDFHASDLSVAGLGTRFRVLRRSVSGAESLGWIDLRVPGRHNVLNALAVVAIASQLELPFPRIAAGLEGFRGVRRRFEICWQDETSRRAIVDDYAHHPTEIAATLSAARAFWPSGRIVTIFQPHRYSRTVHCREAFPGAFRESDVVLLTDIYAAGEDPVAGVSSERLAEEIRAATLRPGQDVRYAGDLHAAGRAAASMFRQGDLILCLGAGSITRLAGELARELAFAEGASTGEAEP